MNKTLKWILIGLAIALGVFIIALPVFYLVRNAGNLAELGRGLMPFRSSPHMPFRSGLMMMPLMGLFGLFRLALPLAVIGFAVFGVIALVRSNSARKVTGSMQTPPPVPPASLEARVCPSCGMTHHSEGDFCPHCGAKQ